MLLLCSVWIFSQWNIVHTIGSNNSCYSMKESAIISTYSEISWGKDVHEHNIISYGSAPLNRFKIIVRHKLNERLRAVFLSTLLKEVDGHSN